MPEPTIALFRDPRGTAQAVHRLEALGIAGIRLASPAPYTVVHRVHRRGSERLLGRLALAGALVGLAGAIALQVFSSTVHPFVVGGKPVLAWPAFTVVCFELTMLGAGVTNFLALAVLGALSRRHVSVAARRAVTSNRLALFVPASDRSPETVEAMRKILADAGEERP